MMEILRHPDHIEIDVRGRLTKSDYDAFVPQIEALAAERGPLRLLIRLEAFQGWEPRALWEELEFDATHQDEMARVAVMGEDGLEKWATKLSKPFFRPEVEYFSSGEDATALQWLARDEPGSVRTASGATAG